MMFSPIHKILAIHLLKHLFTINYFSQQRDTDGKVYLSISDYENLSHLFTEYFGADRFPEAAAINAKASATAFKTVVEEIGNENP